MRKIMRSTGCAMQYWGITLRLVDLDPFCLVFQSLTVAIIMIVSSKKMQLSVSFRGIKLLRSATGAIQFNCAIKFNCAILYKCIHTAANTTFLG